MKIFRLLEHVLEGGGGWVGSSTEDCTSVQQLLELAFFELGIVSDFIKRVVLHNLPVLKHCVQQILQKEKKKKNKEIQEVKER